MTQRTSFWDEPETVERFASREPDHRLVELLERFPEPADTRVLDLGCAAGRNTVYLSDRGFDTYAVDRSNAMVVRTRTRVAESVGRDEAERRVLVGAMDDLGWFEDEFFHLVVALGVYHNARTPEEWDAAMAETRRVLVPAGLLLVSDFGRRTRPDGAPLAPVPGLPGVYEGLPSGRVFLLEADDLDAAMAERGLFPECPTEMVETVRSSGLRVTVNGLYRKEDH
jgi:SAM-dependent methyltransferase